MGIQYPSAGENRSNYWKLNNILKNLRPEVKYILNRGKVKQNKQYSLYMEAQM